MEVKGTVPLGCLGEGIRVGQPSARIQNPISPTCKLKFGDEIAAQCSFVLIAKPDTRKIIFLIVSFSIDTDCYEN